MFQALKRQWMISARKSHVLTSKGGETIGAREHKYKQEEKSSWDMSCTDSYEEGESQAGVSEKVERYDFALEIWARPAERWGLQRDPQEDSEQKCAPGKRGKQVKAPWEVLDSDVQGQWGPVKSKMSKRERDTSRCWRIRRNRQPWCCQGSGQQRLCPGVVAFAFQLVSRGAVCGKAPCCFLCCLLIWSLYHELPLFKF